VKSLSLISNYPAGTLYPRPVRSRFIKGSPSITLFKAYNPEEGQGTRASFEKCERFPGGQIVNDGVKKADETKNDKSKWNWVTERSSCSLPKVFQSLRLQVEEDVKTRNDLRPKNSPYEFSVEESGSDFTVLFVATDVRRSVSFSLAEHGILVRGDKGDQMFEVTLTFNDGGECQLIVNEKRLEFWQVRRMALEELLFQGH
jgi:hypothetical protein